MFREELHRAFINRTFVLALVIAALALVVGLIDYVAGPDPGQILGASPFLNNAFDAFLWGEGNLFVLIAPVIAVLAFGDSFVVDRAKGYLKYILLRSSYWKYLTAKFLANLLAGGTSLALPLLLLYGYTNLAFPRGFPPVINARIPYNTLPGPLGYLYGQSPDVYILFLIGLAFIFGAAYSSLALALSMFIHNRYIVLATPFLLFIVVEFMLQILRLGNWGPIVALAPWIRTSASSFVPIAGTGIVFLASLVCLMVMARKEQVDG